jgi:hypothetical protein
MHLQAVSENLVAAEALYSVSEGGHKDRATLVQTTHESILDAQNEAMTERPNDTVEVPRPFFEAGHSSSRTSQSQAVGPQRRATGRPGARATRSAGTLVDAHARSASRQILREQVPIQGLHTRSIDAHRYAASRPALRVHGIEHGMHVQRDRLRHGEILE